MIKQNGDLNIPEMNIRLESILQGMYKFQEQGLDVKMRVAYAGKKGIYLDNGELLNYETADAAESIKSVIEYERNKKSLIEAGIADVDCMVKDSKFGITKDMLLSSIDALCFMIPLPLLTTVGVTLAGGMLLKTFMKSKSTAAADAAQPEAAELQKEDVYLQGWHRIERTLHNSKHLENCYVSSCRILHNYNDEECLQLCIFQPESKIDLSAEKYCFLTTVLNLFAYYTSFAGTISEGSRKAWNQLWNDEAIVLNAARQILGERCGMGIEINNLGILSAMTYEGKPLQGEILLGSVSDDIKPISLSKPIEFNTDNLRQVCKLMQLCRSGYAMMLDVSDGEDNGKITALVNIDKAEKTGKSVSGKICFLNGKGWYLYGEEGALLEYRNGKYLLPENETAREGMINKLEQYFETSGIWEELVSMTVNLAHGAMIVVTTEAEKEAERLTGKDRGYKVKCKFNKELYSGFTCVDGALIITPDGDCEAFGVIIDGKAVVVGNVERGSRYNSAKNYIAWKKNISEKKKSSAKYAAIVRSDDGNLDIFLME